MFARTIALTHAACFFFALDTGVGHRVAHELDVAADCDLLLSFDRCNGDPNGAINSMTLREWRPCAAVTTSDTQGIVLRALKQGKS